MATGIKTGGRKKGTPNKTTKEIRNTLSLLLSNNLENLQKDIDKLEPKDRIKTLIDISKFIIPTLKAIELKNDNETKPNERVRIVFNKITPRHVNKVIKEKLN